MILHRRSSLWRRLEEERVAVGVKMGRKGETDARLLKAELTESGSSW